jgi:UDP-N-acetylglucosamine 1-carboxyvinyltransferase
MPEKFIIKGGKPLKGEIEARGAKNAAFPILAATLLTDEQCEIDNIPLIEDVFLMLKILKKLGKKVEWIGPRRISVKGRTLSEKNIKNGLLGKFRGSVLLFGPLLAKFKKIKMSQPGGCLIGSRPISTHLDVFRQIGAEIKTEGRRFKIALEKNLRQEVILNEISPTGTENILLLASGLPQKTIIKIADCDYAVQDLVKFLNKMGAKVKLIGPHIYSVQGKKKLKGASHKIVYDPIEAGTFILMAIAARGEVLVKNVELPFLELTLKRLRDFGAVFEIKNNNTVEVKRWTSLKMEKVQALPYPGIPTDLLPLFGLLATQTEGTTLLHEPLYEGRLRYLDELNKMGAQIIFADPHRAIVNGPTALQGITVESPDLRGGASLIAGAVIAKGRTVIHNIYQIDRGYERIEERLRGLGVDIRRVQN